MKVKILVCLVAMAVGCCGSPQEETTTQQPAGGEQAEATPPPNTPPENPPPVEGEERAALIAVLRASMPVAPPDHSAEMRGLVEAGGLEPLVGMTRAQLVAQLGEPEDGPFTDEGHAAWPIGYYAHPVLAHAPILIVTLDDAGVVTEARFQLSM